MLPVDPAGRRKLRLKQFKAKMEQSLEGAPDFRRHLEIMPIRCFPVPLSRATWIASWRQSPGSGSAILIVMALLGAKIGKNRCELSVARDLMEELGNPNTAHQRTDFFRKHAGSFGFVSPHTADAAYAAAELYESTKEHGRGLGDKTCMALAIAEGLPALTTDQAWAKLTVPGLTMTMAR